MRIDAIEIESAELLAKGLATMSESERARLAQLKEERKQLKEQAT
jgi:hypothetical protein